MNGKYCRCPGCGVCEAAAKAASRKPARRVAQRRNLVPQAVVADRLERILDADAS